MFLDISPEHLPLVSTQPGVSTAGPMQVIGTRASDHVRMPHVADDVSHLLIPPVHAVRQAGIFGCTGAGVSHRLREEAGIRAVAAAYSSEDILDGARVSAMSVAFVE